MSIVPNSFTAVGNGPVFRGVKGVPFTYSLSGTFVATLILEKSNGSTWETIATLTAAAVAQYTPTEDASFRFRCSAFTSGTAVTSIYDIVNSEERETVYVDYASTANGTLATAFAAGQSFDGATLATGQLILLKDQSTAADNGLYRVEASGAPTRLTGIELGGVLVYVKGGTVNANCIWQCTTDGVVVPGTTSLAFEQVSGNRTSRTIIVPAGSLGKVGGTAGWVIAAADNVNLATCPASQTAAKLVVPAPTLNVGDIITGYHLIGQIESGGNTATLDADLRKQTAAAADVTDASIGAITQISVTADTAITAANSTKTLASAETVGADETFYVLLTATTAAATDIALQGVAFIITKIA